jgi:translation elongation factor EF-Ts
MTKQEAVKEIRSKAGVPLTWCKEAYDKCRGDIQRSLEWLREHYGNHWAM